MSEIVQVQQYLPQTAKEIKAGVQLIQQVMAEVMKNGTHYGTIPGCGDKPALFKAGAEKIMSTFRIAADPVVEDMSTSDCARFRVHCRGVSPSGIHLGTGVGECSSDEEKYKWKKSNCDPEWEETPEDRRREKWQGGTKPYKVKQIRTNPADVANTVLKMAKKRALVDMVLTCTAASDCFTQDLDEDEYPREDAPPPMQAPQRKSAAAAAPAKTPEPPKQAQPSTDVLGALPDVVGAGLGSVFHVQAIIRRCKEVKTKTSNKDVTYLTVAQQLEDGTEFALECTCWGHHEACVENRVIDFTIQVNEYQGKPSYVASNIVAVQA